MRKKSWLLLAVIAGIALVVGISYALWVNVFVQTNENIVITDCFEVSYTEDTSSNINLTSAFPISESEGALLSPYIFSIKNICSSTAEYQVNMELMSNNTMPNQVMRVLLNEEPSVLLTNEVEATIGERAYKLATGKLYPGESKEYNVRVWMDEETTMEDGASDKIFVGKISVVASYSRENPPLITLIRNMERVTEGSGLYEVSHDEAEITYTSDEVAINNLKQTELRYAGIDPNNYVTFNEESAGWRIIGLVNTPEGQRVKLIRSESIGSYSWDSSDSSVNAGYGVNEWSQADIMTLLNQGAYYNRTSGTCYIGQNNETTSCDFSSNGLTSEAKEMIDTVTWNTGSNGDTDYKTITSQQWYEYERSINNGKICSSGTYCTDNITRKIAWTSQLGLMYASDYGYATSGGDTTDRTTCLANYIYDWDNTEYVSSDCYSNDWLINSIDQWTLTPITESTHSIVALAVRGEGRINSHWISVSRAILPTLYLTTDVKVAAGNGTEENPYVLSLAGV